MSASLVTCACGATLRRATLVRRSTTNGIGLTRTTYYCSEACASNADARRDASDDPTSVPDTHRQRVRVVR